MKTIRAPMNPPLQTIFMSDSRQCNAGCTYCPSRGRSVKERLSLRDLRRVVDFFVAYTNRAEQKPRELTFVLNTLGEPSLGMDNIMGLADYAGHVNRAGRCAVPVHFFMPSTNLLGVPDDLAKFVNQHGYLTVALHGRPVAEYAKRISKFDASVTLEGTDVIPKRPLNLYARYREILEHFHYASMRPVREAPMTMDDSSLWIKEFSELVHSLDALSDAELAGFLTRLFFNDTLMNALRLLNRDAKLSYRCKAGIFLLQVTPEMEFYPCIFTQHPDLRMGDIERGLDPTWYRRFEAHRRAVTKRECASCEFLGVCGGSCLDWARKDPTSDGFFSHAECSYRRGLFRIASQFLAHIKQRPHVMDALCKSRTFSNVFTCVTRHDGHNRKERKDVQCVERKG